MGIKVLKKNNRNRFLVLIALTTFALNASAALLSFDYLATDYVEGGSTNDYVNNTATTKTTIFTPINETAFSVTYDIDFNAPPTLSWGGLFPSPYTNRYNEEIFEGKRYTSYTSLFAATVVSNNSPLTGGLQAMLPVITNPAFTSSSLDALIFTSRVVSDSVTGAVFHDESFEQFYLSDSYGFAAASGPQYNYSFDSFIRMPTFFSSVIANDYSVDDLEQKLMGGDFSQVVFNETITVYEYYDTFYDEDFIGYVGNGTVTFVSEPNSLLLFSLIVIMILRLRIING